MDHYRARIEYKEIPVQAPSSSSNRYPWFFNVPEVKHLYTRGYLWISNLFTSSLVENRNTKINIHESGLIQQVVFKCRFFKVKKGCFISTMVSLKAVTGYSVGRILKINNSWQELFNFQNSLNCH